MQHRFRGLTAALSVALVALALIVAVIAGRVYGGELQNRLGERGPGAPVVDLHGIGQLQAAFDQDVGAPRLVVLFSPT